jgi:outer membrane protein OmpA-like peptidoglycan-associated protein
VAPSESPTEKTVIAQGKILDKTTGSGISGVSLAVKEINKPEVKNYQTDSSGAYSIALKRAKTYTVKYKKPKFFMKTDTISVADGDKPLPSLEVKIEPMVVDKPVRLDNIYYAFNSWEITSKSAFILDGLVKMLNDNPEIDVEIGSHTDTRGDFDINKYVSQQRATSVVRYLVLKGINPRRLSAKGYGKEKPLVHCGGDSPCTEEDHSLNRRTEFKIVKIADQSAL